MSAAGGTLGLGTADALRAGSLTPSLAWVVWSHIERVLADSDGNVSEAARRLGITRRTLQLKRKKHPPRW
jgi:two-component system, response regulator RegA